MSLPPLIVDPDQLTSASSALSSSSASIPTELPKFSVSGSDPLSAAISTGAVDVESPMLALPVIKTKATTTAQNIGVAGQRYRETDELLARKASQQQFGEDDADAHRATDASRGNHSGGIGKFKASPSFGKDLPTLPDDPSGQKSVTDTLLASMAEGGKSAGAGSAGLPGSLMPDKTDWVLGGAGATAQTFSDKIAELTRRGLETGGDGAAPTLKKAVEEIKNPFTFLGKDAPALGSKLGGGVGAIMSIPAIANDVGQGKMSASQAIAREGVGLVAGTVAGAFVSPVLTPVGGAAAGIAAGTAASKLVDMAWVPLAEAQEAFSESGGPGAAMKAARWGR